MNNKLVDKDTKTQRDSFSELLGQLANNSATMVHDEIELLIQRIREKMTAIRSGVITVVIGVGIGFAAFMSLDHPVLDVARWNPVMDMVTGRLLTPVGLRSMVPGHPDYKAKYYGDLRSRDAAYHQGTVWAWLIGPYVDAWLKLNPGKAMDARRFLTGFVARLDEACIGSIDEIFDAEAPYTPRGCVAQAWSVAEVLRSWVNTD